MSPFERQLVRIGGQVVAAGLSALLEQASEWTGELDRRVKRGARRAHRMAIGEIDMTAKPRRGFR